MRKISYIIVLVFFLTLFAASSLIEVEASPEEDVAYIFWVVYEVESFPNKVIDSKGLTLSSGEYDGWMPDTIYVLIEANIGLDEKDKIETNGYLIYAYESGGVTTLAYMIPAREKAFIVKAKGAAYISVKNMTVRYYYCRVEKISYSESGDMRTLNVKVEHDKIKNTFSEKFGEVYAYIFWPGSCELVGLFNPAGSNILENAPEIEDVRWYWNRVCIHFTDLSKYMPVDGVWTIQMKVFDKNSPLLFSYPDIQAFIRVSFRTSTRVSISPGGSRVLYFSDLIRENIPSDWHMGMYSTYLRFEALSGSIDDLEIEGAFDVYKVYNYKYCDLYKNGVKLTNKGFSTLKLDIDTYCTVYKKLNTQTVFDPNDKSKITVTFEVPPAGAIPFYDVYRVVILVYHGGLWKGLNAYTPNGDLIQDIKIYEYGTYYSHFPVYGLRYFMFDLYPDRHPFSGTWKYIVQAPTLLVEDLQKSASITPPYFTGYVHKEDGVVWAHYSVGEEAEFSIGKTVVEVGSDTRIVFSGWKGYGDGFDLGEPSGKVRFKDAEFVKEVALWEKEYLLQVKSEYGGVSGGGWYKEGTKAVVEVSETELTPAEGVKSIFVGWRGDATGESPRIEVLMNGPKNVEAVWKTQYYVKVVSEYGSVSGEGWYDAGSIATITVSPSETGFPIKNVFKHWVVNGQPMQGPRISVKVDNPVLAVAVWEKDYTMLIVIGATLLGMVFLMIIILVLLKRRKRAPTPPPPPPQ